MSEAKKFLSDLYKGEVFDLQVGIHFQGHVFSDIEGKSKAVDGQALLAGYFTVLGNVKMTDDVKSSIKLVGATVRLDRRSESITTACSFHALHGKDTYALLRHILNDLYPRQANEHHTHDTASASS